MELTGEAYFFACLGFMMIVVMCYLLLPRASFIIAISLFVHKAGWINLFDGNLTLSAFSSFIILVLFFSGIVLDFLVLKEFFKAA